MPDVAEANEASGTTGGSVGPPVDDSAASIGGRRISLGSARTNRSSLEAFTCGTGRVSERVLVSVISTRSAGFEQATQAVVIAASSIPIREKFKGRRLRNGSRK